LVANASAWGFSVGTYNGKDSGQIVSEGKAIATELGTETQLGLTDGLTGINQMLVMFVKLLP